MMRLTAIALLCALSLQAFTQDKRSSSKPVSGAPMLPQDKIQRVSPALERYQRDTLFGDLWKRPDLSARDRSIVTLAALIARNQTSELPQYQQSDG